MRRVVWMLCGMVGAALASCQSSGTQFISGRDDDGDSGDGDLIQPPCEGPSCTHYCDDDPCASDETCVIFEGCKLSEGTTCATDSSCASDNCLNSGTCGVRFGSSCTAENCDECMRFVRSPEVTFCAGECSSKLDCAGGSECLGSGGDSFCEPTCHPDCLNCIENYSFEGLDYVLQYRYCVDALEPVPPAPSGMGGGDGDATWDCAGDCDGFACIDAQCLTSCSSSADCASGHSCLPDGACYPGSAEGDPCESSGDCATGFCDPSQDVCQRFCPEIDGTSACGSYRGIQCTCRDDYYCDFNGPDESLTYKGCYPKKDYLLGPSCFEDYECLSDNCCNGNCTRADQICVGEACTDDDECEGFGGCSEPLSGPGVCMENCSTVGEECWNDTVCVSFGSSSPALCMIRCEENEECVAAYGPEYQCEDDGVCRCFEAICPR